MTRADALAVWQDLTRELWPEADVEKSALRIEHQAHVDWLVGSEACECAGPYPPRALVEPTHLPDCPMMAAFEALDMPEGHAEVGRAFDEARPTLMGQWAETAEGTLFGVDAASYDLWRGPQQLRAEGIEQALMRYYRDPLPAYTQSVINPNDTTDD